MGDYIERDAVIKWVESWLNMDRYFRPNGKHDDIPITELYALLKQIPAADVVPVRHGRWIDMGDFISCSVCTATRMKEFLSDYGIVERIDARTNYCPNCGAKMDGGAEDAVD